MRRGLPGTIIATRGAEVIVLRDQVAVRPDTRSGVKILPDLPCLRFPLINVGERN